MTGTLANLLRPDNPALRQLSRHLTRDQYAAPFAFVVILGVLLAIGGACALWQWRRRQGLQPGSHALLKHFARTLGLTVEQRRLLWRIGRYAGAEPAAALVSADLLMQLIQSSERAGRKLTRDEQAEIARILDVVTSAAT